MDRQTSRCREPVHACTVRSSAMPHAASKGERSESFLQQLRARRLASRGTNACKMADAFSRPSGALRIKGRLAARLRGCSRCGIGWMALAGRMGRRERFVVVFVAFQLGHQRPFVLAPRRFPAALALPSLPAFEQVKRRSYQETVCPFHHTRVFANYVPRVPSCTLQPPPCPHRCTPRSSV